MYLCPQSVSCCPQARQTSEKRDSLVLRCLAFGSQWDNAWLLGRNHHPNHHVFGLIIAHRMEMRYWGAECDMAATHSGSTTVIGCTGSLSYPPSLTLDNEFAQVTLSRATIHAEELRIFVGGHDLPLIHHQPRGLNLSFVQTQGPQLVIPSSGIRSRMRPPGPGKVIPSQPGPASKRSFVKLCVRMPPNRSFDQETRT
jgi:hypothetical protein